MGTSNSYKGPSGGTPLVPSWLGDTEELPTPLQSSLPTVVPIPDDADSQNSDLEDISNVSNNPAPPSSIPNTDPNSGSAGRFTEPRSNFTRFAKSGGSNKAALGRAISVYISSSTGGASIAAKRMGSSRRVAAGLVSFLGSVTTQGARAALEAINLGNLYGQSIEKVFAGLIDFICPTGGSVDEGIARNSYIETIAELTEQGITDLDSLAQEQIQTIIEIFATHTIEARLCNDIGTKITIAPENIQAVENAQAQLHNFISRGVSDTLNSHRGDIRNITSIDANNFVDRIYTEAFTILQSLGEHESNNE